MTATVIAASGTRGATRTAEGRAATVTVTATGTAIATAATGIATGAADEDGWTEADGCSDVDFNASGFISSGWIRIMCLNERSREIHTMS